MFRRWCHVVRRVPRTTRAAIHMPTGIGRVRRGGRDVNNAGRIPTHPVQEHQELHGCDRVVEGCQVEDGGDGAGCEGQTSTVSARTEKKTRQSVDKLSLEDRGTWAPFMSRVKNPFTIKNYIATIRSMSLGTKNPSFGQN